MLQATARHASNETQTKFLSFSILSNGWECFRQQTVMDTPCVGSLVGQSIERSVIPRYYLRTQDHGDRKIWRELAYQLSLKLKVDYAAMGTLSRQFRAT